MVICARVHAHSKDECIELHAHAYGVQTHNKSMRAHFRVFRLCMVCGTHKQRQAKHAPAHKKFNPMLKSGVYGNTHTLSYGAHKVKWPDVIHIRARAGRMIHFYIYREFASRDVPPGHSTWACHNHASTLGKWVHDHRPVHLRPGQSMWSAYIMRPVVLACILMHIHTVKSC